LVQKKQTSNMGIWWIALGAAMWGLDGVLIVTLLNYVTSFQIVWIEHMLLLLFAAPVLIWKRHELKYLNLGDWLAVLFIAWGGSALASILFTAGFTYGNPNVVLILQKVQPVFTVLLAAWILKERIVKPFWVMLVVVLIGAYLLTFGLHIPTTDGSTHLIGSLYAIGAAALWGGSTVMGKPAVSNHRAKSIESTDVLPRVEWSQGLSCNDCRTRIPCNWLTSQLAYITPDHRPWPMDRFCHHLDGRATFIAVAK